MVSDIEVALQKCQEVAQQGYEMACNEQLFLRGIIADMRDSLESADDIQSVVYSRLPDDMVFRMHAKALWELEDLDEKLTQDLDLHRENLDEFHIVVFGRTMVGKSTLMEILTHGNGASIGKGGQRTTRDVRSYHWQGMRVTDVPGIGSFEGREDDRLAMEAAKTADLILFLVSDDAPQQDEAAKLAELRALGKPILVLMNVKLSLDGYPERKSILFKKLAKKMSDTDRLAEIEEQFRDFASVYEQDWSDIAFVHSHLNAAYIGDATRAADSELYELSNFSAVESFLLEKNP